MNPGIYINKEPPKPPRSPTSFDEVAKKIGQQIADGIMERIKSFPKHARVDEFTRDEHKDVRHVRKMARLRPPPERLRSPAKNPPRCITHFLTKLNAISATLPPAFHFQAHLPDGAALFKVGPVAEPSLRGTPL